MIKTQHIFRFLLQAVAAYPLSGFSGWLLAVDKCFCDMLQSECKCIISTRQRALIWSNINQYFIFFVVYLDQFRLPRILPFTPKANIISSNNLMLYCYLDIMSLKPSKPQTKLLFPYVCSAPMINVLGWNVMKERLVGNAYSESPRTCGWETWKK